MDRHELDSGYHVPLTRGVETWAEQGHLDLNLDGANFGGSLALLFEASRLSTSFNIHTVRYLSIQERSWFGGLSSRFERVQEISWPSYPDHIVGLSSVDAHSTLRLANEPLLSSTPIGSSIWSQSIFEEVERFIKSESSQNPILFATKFTMDKPKVGDFSFQHWSGILEALSISRSIFVLGSDPHRQAFGDLQVVFLEDRLSMSAQIELASREVFPLIGDASGFFSAGIWHSRPYLCFKDPQYDVAEMEREHNGAMALNVAGSAQYLVRGRPSIAAVRQFLEEAAYARRI